MKTKLELILKFIPAITLVCYICGFVIYKSYLLRYGIIDSNIINIRFLEAGILYLIIAPFVLATTYILNINVSLRGYLFSIFSAIFFFFMYNSIFCPSNLDFLWKGPIAIIILNTMAYFARYAFIDSKKKTRKDFIDGSVIYFAVIMTSLFTFSHYYSEVSVNLGGGKPYMKAFILKEKKDNLIRTDSLNKTDTLTVIYENNDCVYFRDKSFIKSIRKELIEGEICIPLSEKKNSQ